MILRLILPFPPSTNTYYRNFRGRMVISKNGRDYKSVVQSLFFGFQPVPAFTTDVEVTVTLFPPDHRRRDIDNFAGKALWDSIEGLAYENDSQIKCYRNFEWGPVDKQNKGRIEITLKEYHGQNGKRVDSDSLGGRRSKATAGKTDEQDSSGIVMAKQEVQKHTGSPFRIWSE